MSVILGHIVRNLRQMGNVMKYIKIFVVYFVILLLLNILGETLIFMTNLNRVRSSLSEVFIYAFFLSLIFTLVITVFEKRKEFTKIYFNSVNLYFGLNSIINNY